MKYTGIHILCSHYKCSITSVTLSDCSGRNQRKLKTNTLCQIYFERVGVWIVLVLQYKNCSIRCKVWSNLQQRGTQSYSWQQYRQKNNPPCLNKVYYHNSYLPGHPSSPIEVIIIIIGNINWDGFLLIGQHSAQSPRCYHL